MCTGYFIGVTNPQTDTFIMSRIPEETLGTIMSSFYSLITITLPLKTALFFC